MLNEHADLTDPGTCEAWTCPECGTRNHTCQAEDDDHLYVCAVCGVEFELVSRVRRTLAARNMLTWAT